MQRSCNLALCKRTVFLTMMTKWYLDCRSGPSSKLFCTQLYITMTYKHQIHMLHTDITLLHLLCDVIIIPKWQIQSLKMNNLKQIGFVFLPPIFLIYSRKARNFQNHIQTFYSELAVKISKKMSELNWWEWAL